MSERPEATHPESGVTDEVTPDPGVVAEGDVDTEGVDGHLTEDFNTGEFNPEELNADEFNTDEFNTEAVNDPAEDDDSWTGGADGAQEPQAAAANEHPDTRLAAERLADLQRLQAEYVNYKRRVDRDRALVQEKAIADVLDSLLPVLDDIHAAREHGDLTDGPFSAIAEKLEGNLGKFGLERFGARGEAFDPTIHEALLHQEWDAAIEPVDAQATTIVMVLQPGYRTGERIIRPARVAVADPA